MFSFRGEDSCRIAENGSVLNQRSTAAVSGNDISEGAPECNDCFLALKPEFNAFPLMAGFATGCTPSEVSVSDSHGVKCLAGPGESIEPGFQIFGNDGLTISRPTLYFPSGSRRSIMPLSR
jgi:hypothetical protein